MRNMRKHAHVRAAYYRGRKGQLTCLDVGDDAEWLKKGLCDKTTTEPTDDMIQYNKHA